MLRKKSDKANSYQQDLDKLWAKTDKVVLRGMQISRTKPQEWEHTITEKEDIDSLRVVLRVKAPKQLFMYHSSRSIELEFLRREKWLGACEVFSEYCLLMQNWNSNAILVDGDAHVHWLAERGVKRPLERLEAEKLQNEAEERRYLAWRANMPVALRLRWDRLCAAYGVSGTPVGSLSRQITNTWSDLLQQYTQQKAIRLLFSWFSYGQGNWYSGVSMEELLTAKLLRYFPTKKLVRALLAKRATRRQLEGAVRLFGGGDARRAPDELEELPPGLRLRLWRCAKELTCPDHEYFVDYFTPEK
jgi:hypothetical protein